MATLECRVALCPGMFTLSFSASARHNLVARRVLCSTYGVKWLPPNETCSMVITPSPSGGGATSAIAQSGLSATTRPKQVRTMPRSSWSTSPSPLRSLGESLHLCTTSYRAAMPTAPSSTGKPPISPKALRLPLRRTLNILTVPLPALTL